LFYSVLAKYLKYVDITYTSSKCISITEYHQISALLLSRFVTPIYLLDCHTSGLGIDLRYRGSNIGSVVY